MSSALTPVLVLLALGCAGSPADRYRLAHPDWTPGPPRVGASLGEILATLDSPERRDLSVSLRELRVLGIDAEPWTEFAPEALDALGTSAGRNVAVIAHRTCQAREGLRRTRGSEASWFLFSHGLLQAFDHSGFAEHCEAELEFHPGSPEEAETEQMLVRYLAQRFPDARPSIEELLRMGLAYLGVDRIEAAEAMWRTADRHFHSMQQGLKDREPEDPQLPGFEARAAKLRRLRTELSSAIDRARGREPLADPEREFWEGH